MSDNKPAPNVVYFLIEPKYRNQLHEVIESLVDNQPSYVEVQKPVYAYLKDRTPVEVTVTRIDPKTMFYGWPGASTLWVPDLDAAKASATGDAHPVIIHPAPPGPPPVDSLGEPSRLEVTADEEQSAFKVVSDDVDALLAKHGLTYEWLVDFVRVRADFGWEPGRRKA